jgi:teichuronic acid biosynthesis glycosyltransferase TuaG
VFHYKRGKSQDWSTLTRVCDNSADLKIFSEIQIQMPASNSDTPLVSVITPAYNASAFIAECIQSVQAQTHSNWEHVIVDDCSSDDTRAIVERFQASDPKVRLIPNQSNLGVAETRNRAIAEAGGQFVAFLDSDDLWLPEKLERQLAFMKATGAALSFTAYRRITEDGTRQGEMIHVPPQVSYTDLLKNTSIGCLTVMLDRHQTGPVKMEKIKHEDYVLWLSLLRQGLVAHGLDEDLARYRVVKSSITSNKLKSVSWVWNIYRNVEHLGVFQSAYYFVQYLSYAVKKGRTL